MIKRHDKYKELIEIIKATQRKYQRLIFLNAIKKLIMLILPVLPIFSGAYSLQNNHPQKQ
jgi:hypothetical protein